MPIKKSALVSNLTFNFRSPLPLDQTRFIMDGNLISRCIEYGLCFKRLNVRCLATYTLIHAFLTKRSHTKAAEALKKAAKEFVILKDDITPEGPQIEEIITEWKSRHSKKTEDDSSSSE